MHLCLCSCIVVSFSLSILLVLALAATLVYSHQAHCLTARWMRSMAITSMVKCNICNSRRVYTAHAHNARLTFAEKLPTWATKFFMLQIRRQPRFFGYALANCFDRSNRIIGKRWLKRSLASMLYRCIASTTTVCTIVTEIAEQENVKEQRMCCPLRSSLWISYPIDRVWRVFKCEMFAQSKRIEDSLSLISSHDDARWPE